MFQFTLGFDRNLFSYFKKKLLSIGYSRVIKIKIKDNNNKSLNSFEEIKHQ